MLRGVCSPALPALLLALPLHAQDTTPAQAQPSPAPPGSAQAEAQSAPPPTYEITGTARSGKTPLPGATVTASNTLTGKKYSAVSDPDGKFTFTAIAPAPYVLPIDSMHLPLLTPKVF